MEQGLREGGSGGTSYPGQDQGGLGLGGPKELRLSRQVLDLIFFLPCPLSVPDFGQIEEPNLSEDLFLFILVFCSLPNFGDKLGPNLSEDLF